MNTLKSAALTVVLLVVLYAVYTALSKPQAPGGMGDADAPDLGPPLVEFSPPPDTGTGVSRPATAPALMRGDEEASPANTTGNRPAGGAYQPSPDAASLSPPTAIPASAPPLDPSVADAGELRRSAFESPAAGEPQKQPAADSTSASGGSSSSLVAWSLTRDWQQAEQLVADGKFKAALAQLSPYYGSPDLDSEQRAHLVAWLDALAAKVIYSREHLLAPPYPIRKNETLFDIAEQLKVPWRLLKNINADAISDPSVLVAGTELKVVPGPFRADVNLAAGELTVFLGELYAGRFPLTLGDQPPPPGQYRVLDKRGPEKSYYALDGRVIPANDPANPYGGVWLWLGGEVCIHGSPATPSSQTLGCISLSPQDARDVYAILAINSEVTIRR